MHLYVIGITIIGGRPAMDAYDLSMRRGWILLTMFVLLLLITTLSWWWSTPGQLWWMTKKWEWWVLPKHTASPGGATPEAIVDDLNPQWDRLLRRGYVTPYCRVWDPAPDQNKLDEFDRRVMFQSPLPLGMGGHWGPEKWLDDKKVLWRTDGARTVLRVTLLIPPDQHQVVAGLTQDIFGDVGKSDEASIPIWWRPSGTGAP